MNRWNKFLKEHGGKGLTSAQLRAAYRNLHPDTRKPASKKTAPPPPPKKAPSPPKKAAPPVKKGLRGKCGSDADCQPGLFCSSNKRCAKPKQQRTKAQSAQKLVKTKPCGCPYDELSEKVRNDIGNAYNQVSCVGDYEKATNSVRNKQLLNCHPDKCGPDYEGIAKIIGEQSSAHIKKCGGPRTV